MITAPIAIRNAVIHLANEQPLLADLFAPPVAGDLVLICTNLRTLGGKRPVFADDSRSIFYFPFTHIRFLEIPPGADGSVVEAAPSRRPEPEPEEDLEIDEDFLRRVKDV
ncbi:MAG TPA: hypothetical protein VH723_00335 [Candidatus Limnocylindrales bacterium]